jgi:hypothetical protein
MNVMHIETTCKKKQRKITVFEQQLTLRYLRSHESVFGVYGYLVMAAFGSQRKRRIGPIFILHPVPVTAPCKPQVPREARGLRRASLRRFTTSKQRFQRLKVCQKSPSSSVRQANIFFLLRTVPADRTRAGQLEQPRIDARLVENMLAFAWQDAHVVAVLKINDANRARLTTDCLW